MLLRCARRLARSQPARLFSDNKPPKGFEKFYKDQEGSAKKEEEKSDPPPPEPEGPRGPKRKFNWNEFKDNAAKFRKVGYVGLGAVAAFSLYKLGQAASDSVPDISFNELMNQYVESDRARSLTVLMPKPGAATSPLTSIMVEGTDARLAQLRVPDLASFLKRFELDQLASGRDRTRLIPIQYKVDDAVDIYTSFDRLWLIMSYASQFAIFGGIMFVLFKLTSGKGNSSNSGGGGGFSDMFSMSKPSFRVYGTDIKINVTFKDVAGLQEAKKEIMEFVEFLKAPEKFKKLGARIPRGALLVGPPGTGKTLIAKAAAGEAGVPFFSISGSEFVEMFVGVGASRVRQLFKSAREKAPSIIFIDEIDAVGRKRFGRVGGNDERDNTLNQLLVEMDGFTTDSHVVVLAGTNRKDILDSALTRAGRFDRTIELTLPDLEGRTEILKVHLNPLKLNAEQSTEEYARRIASLTPGFTGADLSNLCNEAAINAARTNKESVDRTDFENASERVIGGFEKSKRLSDKERSIVAHHEAGHAVSGWFLEGADPVLKVSILPRSKGALGFAQFLPSETSLYNKEELLDKICAILGGRVAEEMFFGKVTTGAQDDLAKATQIAQALVTNFGMNERFGMVGYNVDSESFSKPFSEDSNRIIDEEVRGILSSCLDRTRTLLKEKRELVAALAALLLEKERAVNKDLNDILGPRPFAVSDEYRQYLSEDTAKTS
jgi:AFG3 family protein